MLEDYLRYIVRSMGEFILVNVGVGIIIILIMVVWKKVVLRERDL